MISLPTLVGVVSRPSLKWMLSVDWTGTSKDLPSDGKNLSNQNVQQGTQTSARLEPNTNRSNRCLPDSGLISLRLQTCGCP